jgi:hypothetical protein
LFNPGGALLVPAVRKAACGNAFDGAATGAARESRGVWISIASGTVPRFNDGMKKAKSSTHRTDQSHKLEQMDYRPWKARCAALLERQGIFSGVVRERQWRQLFATGVTAEQAVERAQMHYNNGRGALWGGAGARRRRDRNEFCPSAFWPKQPP